MLAGVQRVGVAEALKEEWAVLPYPRRQAVYLEITMVKLHFETLLIGKGKYDRLKHMMVS